ncbi:MAG: hypothetical protein H0U52_13375 [Chloroflexi bacterium]|nr:hypothetical protein [Chloroflexota bacterium]
MANRRIARFGVVVSTAAVVLAMSAGAAMAGEVTGNGKPLWTNGDVWGVEHTLHGKSLCAFSGQEDDQFPASPFYSATAGHAQSWGQIPKVFRDELTVAGFNPGIACNPTKSGGE